MNETGLPDVPEGHFWRVCGSSYNSDMVRVELRKKTRFSSRCVQWTCFRKSSLVRHGYTIEETIRFCAESVLDDIRQRLRQEDLEPYMGDYPPKSLERALTS